MHQATTHSIGRRRAKTGRLAAILLVAPLLVFLAAAFYYPLTYTLTESVTGPHGPTLTHYIDLFGSRAGWEVLELTLVLSTSATILSIVLSIPLALLLRRKFAGKGALQFLTMLPITIPSLVGALGLVILYDRTGWLNYLLVAVLHVTKQPVPIDYTIPGIILFYVWMFFPYGGLVLMSGVGALDPALEEAGKVMGGSSFYVFRRVMLPLLKPSIWAGAILVFLQCFGAFSVPLIAGGNHQPLAVKIYTVATVFLDWPQASAMAVVMAVVQCVLVVAYQRSANRDAGRTS